MAEITPAQNDCCIVSEDSKSVGKSPRELYEGYHAEASKRDLSNSENLDKSVLTYSSAGFALSLGFLKDFVPISKATVPWTLYGSWVFFNLAIVLTISSFVISQLGLKRQLALAYEYYIERNDAALDQKNIWSEIVTIVNYGAGGAFIFAVILTTAFVSFNLEKAGIMTEQKTRLANDGASIPSLQKISNAEFQRGASIPPMQQVPASPQSQPTSQSSTPPSQNK